MSHKVILHCTEDGQGSTKTEQGEENIYHELCPKRLNCIVERMNKEEIKCERYMNHELCPTSI